MRCIRSEASEEKEFSGASEDSLVALKFASGSFGKMPMVWKRFH